MERNGFQLNESIQLIDPTSISEQGRKKRKKFNFHQSKQIKGTIKRAGSKWRGCKRENPQTRVPATTGDDRGKKWPQLQSQSDFISIPLEPAVFMPPLHGHALPAPPARRTLRWWETPRFEFIMIIRRTERWDSRLSRECRLPSILPFSPRSTVSPDQSLLLHLLLSSPFPTHRRLIAFVSGAYRRRSST